MEVDILLKHNSGTIIQGLRKIPLAMEKVVENEIGRLLRLDIIEPVDEYSPVQSPIVLVEKKSVEGEVKKYRLCIDLKAVNKHVLKETHPFPTWEQLTARLQGATVFSKMDLKDAFFHLKLSKGSRHITTFVTHLGLFRYKRLFFGLSSASEIFQRTMENIFRHLKGVIIIIDDILVFGKDSKEHDENLKAVKETIGRLGLKTNEEKEVLGVTSIVFNGHTISDAGIFPNQKSLRAIQECEPPKNSKDLKSFLGLMSYIGSKFIKDLATVSEPLRKLTVKNAKFIWSDPHQKAFEELKLKAANVKTLGYFSRTDSTTLYADAGPTALGAVLTQARANGENVVVAYASKSLSKPQQNYSQTEKETLALVWATKHFQYYLRNYKFTLVTDHKALETLFKPRAQTPPRLERWILQIQEFDFEVKYVKGDNMIADPLSRLCDAPEPACQTPEIERVFTIQSLAAVSAEELKVESENDRETVLIIEALKSGIWPEEIKDHERFATQLWANGPIVFRNMKIRVPQNLRSKALQIGHEGHPGILFYIYLITAVIILSINFL